ncbi:MAG: hypothetical protein JWQ03_1999 [Variovorax sp.]|nr:hypothetical protein [Variovorax sp.]
MNATELSRLSSAATARGAPAARKVCFEVPAAQALTFKARQASMLRVMHGRLWVTREGARAAPAEDLVLGEGATLRLARGERVVLESWNAGQPGAAWFCSEEAPARC